MNTRNLFFTTLLIVALALGAGLILAQDEGGNGDEDGSAKMQRDYGRRGGFHFGRGFHGFGGRGMMMPGGPALIDLVREATGLEPDALHAALRDGDSLAALIEANGGDAEAFITEATAAVTESASARIAERIEAMVQGEHPAGMKGADGRGRGAARGFPGRAIRPMAGMQESLLEATGLEPRELFNALRSGVSLAGLIEANGGDVEVFIAEVNESFNARVDAALADGKLSEERAALLKEGMGARLEAMVQGEFPLGMKGGRGEGAGEHGGRGKSRSESGGAGDTGEESGATYALDETFDTVRKGVRLVMNWDANAGAFVGEVENVTDATIPAVRVEVHLSNGVELGPTPRADLAPGETRAVELSAAGITGFDGWTPHAEMGAGDSGGGEHGGRGEGGSG